MATPGRLVERMAELTGVPKPTVSQTDRVLADAKLRSKSGRGPSSARVIARDGANQLVGLMAADRVIDAAKAVERYQKATLDKEASQNDGLIKLGVSEIDNLPAGHNFVDLLEALISASGDGNLEQVLGSYHDPSGVLASTRRTGPHFEIMFESPHTVGRFRVFGAKHFGEYVYGLAVLRKVTLDNLDDAFREVTAIEGTPRGDLRQINIVTSTTIYGLGALISGRMS